MTKRAADADVPIHPKSNKKCPGAIVEIDLTTHDALDLVLKQGVLHWSDAVTLGSVCKKSHKLYKQHRKLFLSPLLKQLERMVGSNTHKYCGMVFAPKSKRQCSCASNLNLEDYDRPCNQDLAALDPRYHAAYETWSTTNKCRQMVAFLETIVGNMKKKFCFQDPTHASAPREHRLAGKWAWDSNTLPNFFTTCPVVLRWPSTLPFLLSPKAPLKKATTHTLTTSFSERKTRPSAGVRAMGVEFATQSGE
jgi:hypothetical protein